MTAVYQEWDRRLAVVFGGRTPILAAASFPRDLFGKFFWFTDGSVSKYADRLNGHAGMVNVNTTEGGGYIPRVYDHAQFEAAEAAADMTGSLDNVNHIALIPKVASSFYGTLPQHTSVGFFEHSLRAHRKSIVNPVNGVMTEYYLHESGIQAPEKRFDYALAEIMIEGITSVSFPDSWDKYKCFRVHNLNYTSATINFGAHFAVTLGAMECRTIRRDSPTTGYRVSDMRYFFPYEAGDPRFYWFWPQGFSDGQAYTVDSVNNAHVANNLVNFSILFEWARRFVHDPTSGSQSRGAFEDVNEFVPDRPPLDAFAWMTMDGHEHWDAYPMNSEYFGDPSVDSTLLGDLIHHRGEIIIAKTHKELNENDEKLSEKGGVAKVEFDSFRFNGYATITQDFAAKGLNVTVSAAGDRLTVSKGADPDWHWDLIPIGTNLFKNGASNPSHALQPSALRVSDGAVAVIGQGGWLESQDDVTITTLGAIFFGAWVRQLFPSDGDVKFDAQYYTYSFYGPDPDPDGSRTATVVNVPGFHWMKPLGLVPLSGVNGVITHNVTVGDLKTLRHLGWRGTPGPVQLVNPRLMLTGNGLVLMFTEQIDPSYMLHQAPNRVFGSRVWDKLADDGYRLKGGVFERNRTYRFRGHGWPYWEAGRGNTAFFGPRRGRHLYNIPVQGGHGLFGDIKMPDGSDFVTQPPNTTETNVKQMTLLPHTRLNTHYGGRFWVIPDARLSAGPAFGPPDGLVGFDRNHRNSTWAWPGVRNTLASSAQDGPTLNTRLYLCLSLLPELYNNAARLVNACKTARPLDYRAYRFVVGSGPSAQATGFMPNVGGAPGRYGVSIGAIVPVEAFEIVIEGDGVAPTRNLQLAFYEALGVPLREATISASHRWERRRQNAAPGIRRFSSQLYNHPLPWNPSYDPRLPHNEQRLVGASTTRYFSILDVKAVVDAMGLPFNFHEIFQPLQLDGNYFSTATDIARVTWKFAQDLFQPHVWDIRFRPPAPDIHDYYNIGFQSYGTDVTTTAYLIPHPAWSVEDEKILEYAPGYTETIWHHILLPAKGSPLTVALSGITLLKAPEEDSFYDVLFDHRHLTVDLT